MGMDVIREALHRRPFQPFILRLTDGRELMVSQLGCLAVMPGRVAFVSPIDDSVAIIPANEIVSVAFFDAQENAQDYSARRLSDKEKAMQINTIREALHKQPFRPFTLRLADGRELPVPHPDFVAILGRTAVVASPSLDDSYSVVEPLLIVSIEYASPAGQSAAGTNTGGNS